MDFLIADLFFILSGFFAIPRISGHFGAQSGGLAVDNVTTIDALEALADEWRALERLPGTHATPFQTHRFHMTWARHFTDTDRSFRIVTVRSEGRLALAMPLSIRRTPIGNVAEWMGEPVIQYGDVICTPYGDTDALLSAAFEALTGDNDISVLDLRRVRADAACAKWLDANVKALDHTEEAIGVDLTGFAVPLDYVKARTSRAARNRKRQRKLGKMGGVRFHVARGGEQAADLVSAAFDLKQAWLDERGKLGRALMDSRTLACLRALAFDGEVAASVLEVGGDPAAIELGLRHARRHCAYMGAYDIALAKIGPGNIQMQHTIEWCITQGDTMYDLMTPADPYKQELGTIAVQVKDYLAVLSMRGLPAAIWSTLGQRTAKSAFESLPKSVRTAIRKRIRKD